MLTTWQHSSFENSYQHFNPYANPLSTMPLDSGG